MPINIQDYLLGRIPVGRKIDIPAYLMAKAAGGKIQEITGTLPLYVRSRASQILQNYIIYGTASGAGVETENLLNVPPVIIVTSRNNYYAEYRISGDAKTQIINELNSHLNEEYTISLNITTEYTGNTYFVLVLFYADGTNLNVYSTRQFTPTKEVININLRVQYNNASGNGKTFTFNNTMIVKGSTAPSSYIPYGYKLPITVASNGTTTDYPIYIGDSQLMEGEYVDYEEQKIYKLVDGTLTPTDPPVPLPDITLPQGIVAIDAEGEVKPQATIKGKIEQI